MAFSAASWRSLADALTFPAMAYCSWNSLLIRASFVAMFTARSSNSSFMTAIRAPFFAASSKVLPRLPIASPASEALPLSRSKLAAAPTKSPVSTSPAKDSASAATLPTT